jgi:hypothetical protein
MRRAIHGVLILMAGALGACSASLPKVAYDAPAAVTSERTATIATRIGTVQGLTASTTVPAGGIFVTIPGGRAPDWVNFNDKDAALFASSLRDELNRLGIVKAQGAVPGMTADIALNINFDRTIKGHNNDYQLEVHLQIEAAGKQTLKRYSVRSFDGADFMTRFNTTPATGKRMAAQRLMKEMIPDIETAVRELDKADSLPGAPSS